MAHADEVPTDTEVTRHEHVALAFAAVVAIATIVWLMSPVGTGMLLGVFLASTLRPTYERIVRRWPPPAAALATVLGSALAMALTLGGLVWIYLRGVATLAPVVVRSLGPDGGARKVVIALGDVANRIGLSTEELHTKAHALVVGLVGRAESFALAFATATGSAALALFFEMLTMYFVLLRWHQIARAAENVLPLRPEYTRKLLDEFRSVGRSTLTSTVVIGLLQGALAAVGYWIAGLPEPLFFGALTTVASVVPAVGTLIVWLPAAIALVLSGHVGSGIFLAAWGVVVLTGIPTYVISPRLVGKGSAMPTLFTFISLFGGSALFGLKGAIVGPVLMTLAIAILRIYAEEERARKHLAPS